MGLCCVWGCALAARVHTHALLVPQRRRAHMCVAVHAAPPRLPVPPLWPLQVMPRRRSLQLQPTPSCTLTRRARRPTPPHPNLQSLMQELEDSLGTGQPGMRASATRALPLLRVLASMAAFYLAVLTTRAIMRLVRSA